MRQRIMGLVFVMVLICSMSFTQLGFWSIGVIDGKSVYLMFLLGPLTLGAFLFSPAMGALLGLFTGAVVCAHALFLPLDFYEVYFVTPLNSFALFTVSGFVAGLLFARLLRKSKSRASRWARIIVTCLATSLVATSLTPLNTIVTYGGLQNLEVISVSLLNSPLGARLQALLDALLMIALCLVADIVVGLLTEENPKEPCSPRSSVTTTTTRTPASSWKT